MRIGVNNAVPHGRGTQTKMGNAKMKVTKVILATALLLVPASFARADDAAPAADAAAAPAEDPDLVGKDAIPGSFVGNIGFVNDYLFRGITQTRHDPAVQGSIEYDHPSGVYVGTWASSIDFAGLNGTHAQLETDFYGGYKTTIDAFSWGVEGYGYYYFDTQGVNYAEGSGSLGYDFGVAQLAGSVWVSPELGFNGGTGVYGEGDLTIPIWKSLALAFHGGHQTIENNANFGTPDYTEWAITVSAIVLGFNVSVAYHDTDLTQAECFGGTDLCAARGVISISRSF